MARTTPEALATRLDVQAIAPQELARALGLKQASVFADALRQRVASLAGPDMSKAADVAIAAELAPLLDALRGPQIS